MSTELETRLRTALHDTAAGIPRATHLTQIDYHPRTPRAPRLALGRIATATTAAAGATAAIVALTGGASTAFAGWKAKPTAPLPGQVGAAGRQCAAQQPINGLPLVLSDVRGPFTFQVYADAKQSATCINGPSFTSVSGSASSAPVTVQADQILLSGSHTSERDGQKYSFAVGRAGSSVTNVTLNLTDGTDVTATVQNGWFVAWWPSNSDVKSATIGTATGTTTQTMPAAQRTPPCPSGATCGSASGSKGSASAGGAVTGSSSVTNR